jgi:hypothetical protein
LIFSPANIASRRGATPLAREIDEQAYGLVGDPVLGIVKEKARGLQAEALVALGIVGEQAS